MSTQRTKVISVVLTLEVVQQLDAYAAEHRWTRSTAAAELIERGLPGAAPELHEQDR